METKQELKEIVSHMEGFLKNSTEVHYIDIELRNRIINPRQYNRAIGSSIQKKAACRIDATLDIAMISSTFTNNN